MCDGHAKVHVKCGSLDKKHPGKPRANGKRKPYGYGWFMAVDPRTLRVLGVSCLHQPEGNEVMDGILTRLLPKYPKLDGVVMDRACAFLPHEKRTKKFAQVGYIGVSTISTVPNTVTNALATPIMSVALTVALLV